MRIRKTERGLVVIEEETYLGTPGVYRRLIQESSIIGDHEDSHDIPGSSYLWVGRDHHLDRGQVAELIGYLQYWIDNKRLHEGIIEFQNSLTKVTASTKERYAYCDGCQQDRLFLKPGGRWECETCSMLVPECYFPIDLDGNNKA